jgi:hypothetical protein
MLGMETNGWKEWQSNDSSRSRIARAYCSGINFKSYAEMRTISSEENLTSPVDVVKSMQKRLLREASCE